MMMDLPKTIQKFLFVFCLLFSQQGVAAVVSPEEASQLALQFLQQRYESGTTPSSRKLLPKNMPLQLALAEKQYYVFNVGQSEGFVLVSGDDTAPAILGYADQGEFDGQNIPANMQHWLNDYASQLAYLKDHPSESVLNSSLDEHVAIEPMLTSTWNQGSPYNNMCPYDGTRRSVTGCVATAMAQVLYYHKHPSSTTATIPSYVTDSKYITVAAIGVTTIDWDHMKDSYSEGGTSTQMNAVARLMQLCGASIKMDYSYNGSGAYSTEVPKALKNYFDYDEATSCEDRGHYRANEWHNMIYEELANKRPVCYGGLSMGGGHSFVIDGYDKDGLFHVNWGWGGQCDGYFLLSVLDPGDTSGIGASTSNDGYSFAQDAIIGAQPNTGTDLSKVRLTTFGIDVTASTLTKNNDGQFPVTFSTEMYNEMGNTYDFEVGMGVYDASNQQVYAESFGHAELESNWGWSSFEASATIPGLSDGTYSITIVSRRYNTDVWYKNLGSNTYSVIATVSGQQMQLQGPVVDLSATLEVSGDMAVDGQLKATATIENKGTFFSEQLFLRVDGEDLGGRYFEVDAASSEKLEMGYTPTSNGVHTLSIGYKTYSYSSIYGWQEGFVALATTRITVGQLDGDANNDGQVTMSDVVAMVAYVLGTREGDFLFENADMNGDGNVTMGDVVGVLKIVLGK